MPPQKKCERGGPDVSPFPPPILRKIEGRRRKGGGGGITLVGKEEGEEDATAATVFVCKCQEEESWARFHETVA